MTTKTKQVMEEEIKNLNINIFDFADGYNTVGDYIEKSNQALRQSIIRILETAMEEVAKIKVVEVPAGTIISDSDQVFIAGQINVMMRANDRIQSILNSIKE